VAWGSTDVGAVVFQWPWNGDANQRWRMDDLADGTFSFINSRSGQALDIDGAVRDGAGAIQWPWNGGATQRWRRQAV
jgi:hypothetical protein